MKGFIFMNKKFGFTLTEVLITLAVIGVVSAITVPNLLNKSAKKTQAALIHKAYVELSDAVELYMNDEDKQSVDAPFKTLDNVEHFLTHYYRINKNCGSTPVAKGCLSATYGTISGTTGLTWGNGPYNNPEKFKCIQNKSGITVCMCEYKGVHSSSAENPSQDLIDVWFDTNGNHAPNINGRDIFRIYVNKDGDLVTWNEDESKYDNREAQFNEGCLTTADPDDCMGKLLNDNWQMNY